MKQKLDWLFDGIENDILEMTDEEVEQELKEAGLDPEKIAEEVDSIFKTAINKSKRNNKTFIETMFNNLDSIDEDEDEEVEQELIDMGIDLNKTKEKITDTLNKQKEK